MSWGVYKKLIKYFMIKYFGTSINLFFFFFCTTMVHAKFMGGIKKSYKTLWNFNYSGEQNDP